MKLQEIVAKLSGVREVEGGYVACCPAHTDKRPSLSVSAGDEGGVLLYCHAGCSTSEVVEALGLKMSDLMPDDDRQPVATKSHGTSKVHRSRTFPTAELALTALDQLGKRTGVWVYRDANGDVVGVVGRWDTDVGKTIRPVSRNGKGWKIAFLGSPWPLYRLPKLADYQGLVYVVEGEKAADAGVTIGLNTTTSVGGSRAASKTDWSPLAGRDVVILPDNDDAGEAYASDTIALLHALEPPAHVRIVKLPHLPDKGDIADWVDMHDAVESEQLRGNVETLVEAAPIILPTDGGGTQSGEGERKNGVVRCMADVEPRRVLWLWPGRIPRGRLTLIVGRPGEGKSLVTLDLAARVSAGRDFPDGRPCEPGAVLLLSAEDDPHDTLRPRLDAALADVSRVHLLSAVRTDGGERCVTLFDLGVIEESLRMISDCRVVIVDPIGSYLGRTDAHRDNEVRAVLAPLASLAERFGVAVLVVAHRRKANAEHADDTTIGSRAFTGIARAVWHVSRERADPDLRYFLAGKSNIAPESTGLAFRIGGDPPRIDWQRQAVTMSADDALRAESVIRQRGPKPREREEVAEWLREALSDGPRRATDMQQDWEEQGFKRRTVDRAKRAIGVQSVKDANEWWWQLPGDDERSEQP